MKTRIFFLLLNAVPLLATVLENPEAVRHAQARFMAPCCWHENLSVHASPIAVQMRGEIAEMVARGQSEDQIVNHYVAKYGERILSVPRGRPFWVLTLTPIALISAAILKLLLFLRRLAMRPHLDVPMALPNLPEITD